MTTLKNITDEELERELKKIVAEIAEVDEEAIQKDTHFVEELGMDSMLALEVLATIEKKFSIRIDESYLSRWTSLAKVVLVVKEVSQQSAAC